MTNSKAVSFETDRRIHISVAVKDIQKSIAFYQKLFEQRPTKVRPNYAKFEVAEPPVNLSLNESQAATGPTNSAAHFGIQVKSAVAVDEMTERFDADGLETAVEDHVACCYAVQKKVWVSDPDGNRWEVFVVVDGQSSQLTDESSKCCLGTSQKVCCDSAAACCE